MTAERAPLPSPPYGGACLCGAVRFSVTKRPRAFNVCHCTLCWRMTGAERALLLQVDADGLTHNEAPLSRWRKTADSGRQTDIVRCAGCGSLLWLEPLSAPGLRIVAAGALDDPSFVMPTSHIYAARMFAHDAATEGALVLDGPPADRAILWAHFDALYPA